MARRGAALAVRGRCGIRIGGACGRWGGCRRRGEWWGPAAMLAWAANSAAPLSMVEAERGRIRHCQHHGGPTAISIMKSPRRSTPGHDAVTTTGRAMASTDAGCFIPDATIAVPRPARSQAPRVLPRNRSKRNDADPSQNTRIEARHGPQPLRTSPRQEWDPCPSPLHTLHTLRTPPSALFPPAATQSLSSLCSSFPEFVRHACSGS